VKDFMNRKKKLIELVKKQSKKPDNRKHRKEKYISKAERAKLALKVEAITQHNVTGGQSSEQ
jgi:hypothetical protein